ncbi:MAG: protein kinase [Gordonia sp. (in: high G+C Gram-positive bacteria)]
MTTTLANRYRIVRRIGAGGMGTVWLAHDDLLDREVAVKQVVDTSNLSDDDAQIVRQRAMREGRIAARLSHRNSIVMHDVVVADDDPWLIMEFFPSVNVAELIKRSRTLDATQTAQIGAQVADALVAAHAAGIVHRDVKPANIMIADSGRDAGLVKITDFGISRLHGDVSVTQTGLVTGTPAYLAPEIARGGDPRIESDVYSLGATLYTMLEGTPPAGDDDNYMALLHRVASGTMAPMTVTPAGLAAVIAAMLSTDPQARPTMAVARDQLADFAAGSLGNHERVMTGMVTKPLRDQQGGGSQSAATRDGSPQSGDHRSGPRLDKPVHSPTRQAPPDYMSNDYPPTHQSNPSLGRAQPVSQPGYAHTSHSAGAPVHTYGAPQPGMPQPGTPQPGTLPPGYLAPQSDSGGGSLAAAIFLLFVVITVIAVVVILLT